MPYTIKKQDCKQSDGDSGTYVLSYTDKKGKKHRICHTSKKKAKGQIAAIEMPRESTLRLTEKRLRQIIREELQMGSSFFGPKFDQFKRNVSSGMLPVEAAESAGLEQVGRGMTRKVYTIPGAEDVVLKVAHAEGRGGDMSLAMSTNRDEASNSMATRHTIFPKVYERDQQGLWILSEKVRPLTSREEMQKFFPEADIMQSAFIFPMILSIASEEIRLSPEEFQQRVNDMKKYERSFKVLRKFEALKTNSTFNKIANIIAEYRIEPMEIRADNVGVAQRNGKEELVVLDVSTGFALKERVLDFAMLLFDATAND